jgi:proteic killer suppression protein
MVKTFGDKETEKIFNREFSRKLPPTLQRAARQKLEVLNAAEALQDLRVLPSNHLEKLAGKRKGQHSIRINDPWRICFVWKGTDAYQVEIVDYHS